MVSGEEIAKAYRILHKASAEEAIREKITIRCIRCGNEYSWHEQVMIGTRGEEEDDPFLPVYWNVSALCPDCLIKLHSKAPI